MVVEDVSLSVKSGEVVGLLGPNGAGKTTSFYMIVGLVRADAGRISIDGQSVERMPIHKRARMGLSYLPQEASIFRKLTVEENIRAVLELQVDAQGKPLGAPEIEKRTDALLRDLRVEHLRKSAAPSLSAVSAGAWRSHAHWPASRALSCSTNPLLASIRLRSLKSSASSAFSRRAASVS
jgi:lipopolysaccharide export system ATP-binding protein